MRKIFTIFPFVILFLSCQQSENEFSCDLEVNEFVKNNRKKFAIVKTREFSSYDIHLQKAVYNSWGDKKKRQAWIDKLEYVLANNSFSKKEIDHILRLKKHIGVSYFDQNRIKKNQKEQSVFARDWIDYAQNELGWTKKEIAFLVYRLYFNEEQFDAELFVLRAIKANAEPNSESGGGSCDCSFSSDFCGNGDCFSGGCTISSGCGWLWSQSCNGSCY